MERHDLSWLPCLGYVQRNWDITMRDDVIYWEVSADEYRAILKETINSIDTHEIWRHTGWYVTRAYPCTTVLGHRALHIVLSGGDEWLVAQKV